MENDSLPLKPRVLIIGNSPSQHAVARELCDKFTVTTLPNVKDTFAVFACLALAPEYIIDLGLQSYPEHADFIATVHAILPDLKLYIMESSINTYGHALPEDGPFTEDTKQYPISRQRIEQVAVENYLNYMEYEVNFPYCIVRRATLFSEYPLYILQCMQELPERMTLGDSTTVGSYIDESDLARLYASIMAKPEKARGDTFVTGPNNAVTNRELFLLLRDKLNWQGTVQWEEGSSQELYYSVSNPQYVRKTLGWTPKVSLTDGIDKLIERYARMV